MGLVPVNHHQRERLIFVFYLLLLCYYGNRQTTRTIRKKGSKQFKAVPIHVWTLAELASTKALCCSWQSSGARCVLEEPMDWADGFMVVYNISDRASFIKAKNLLRQIRETRLEHCKGSVAASSSILPAAFHCSFPLSGTGNGALRRDGLTNIFLWLCVVSIRSLTVE